MTSNYKSLIEEIKKAENNPSDDSLKFALWEIYLERDVKSAIKLTNYLSEYYVKNYKGYEGYSDAYFCVKRELDYLAKKADYLFGENRNIQKFYRKAINFSNTKDVNLN